MKLMIYLYWRYLMNERTTFFKILCPENLVKEVEKAIDRRIIINYQYGYIELLEPISKRTMNKISKVVGI